MREESTVILFSPGRIVATPSAVETVPRRELDSALARHLHGDWGELCDEDKQANQLALKHCDRLFSAYKTEAGTKFWIITEADRSATTILLPDEY